MSNVKMHFPMLSGNQCVTKLKTVPQDVVIDENAKPYKAQLEMALLTAKYIPTSEFWDTMKIMVERDWKKNIKEDIQDWLDKVIPKRIIDFSENEIDANISLRDEVIPRNSDEELILLKDIKRFLRKLKLSKVECEFSHPQIRSRLEKLMGSNIVRLTDRNYMQRLQNRIMEDYSESMEKRIRAREDEELERVKNLVLIGKIPLDQAPSEMAQHPVMLIEKYCNKLIAERRAKIKIYKVKIPTYLYWDDTPDPESGLSIEKGHVFRNQGDQLCNPYDRFLQSSEEDDIKDGYMLSPEEYERIKYEDPLIKKLRTCETVEEMYALANEIIGALKTIDESSRVIEDVNSENLEKNNSSKTE